MIYEVAACKRYPDEWRVEAIDLDGEGEIYVAIFSGPMARERAEEYAERKNARTSATHMERRTA